MYPGGNALLHGLANDPVLPVHHVPEVDGVGGVEVGFLELEGLKEKVTGNVGAVR
jgi:hypothetical protein